MTASQTNMAKSNLERCLAYLDKLPRAVDGSGGHDATFLAACECVRFGLSDSEMWEAMSWYNANRCDPPWTEKELRHKVESATKKARFGERIRSHAKRTVKPVTAEELRALSERAQPAQNIEANPMSEFDASVDAMRSASAAELGMAARRVASAAIAAGIDYYGEGRCDPAVWRAWAEDYGAHWPDSDTHDIGVENVQKE